MVAGFSSRAHETIAVAMPIRLRERLPIVAVPLRDR
jgi:hypothetical protein